MRLESLQIAGFKSFAEPVLLEFPETITVVVGPNGSGKSNVVDAVRWVLGEQSARNLRCNRMDELIFSGSESRRRLGLAEVIANFRNGSEEISIARRIDRSGRSDYRINGRRCRLRDIHDLFFDTGLGRSSYAVIGQGEVERIVEARGDEIRGYVEEVAGVERHRMRMTDIQRNLRAARDDLRRLDDVLGVREEYLEPLREQAKRARLHRLLTTREEDVRSRVAEADLARAAAEVNKVEQQRYRTVSRLRSIGQSYERLRREHAGRQEKRDETAARRKLVGRGLENLQKQRDECRSELAVLDERRRSIETSQAQARQAVDEVRAAQREMQEERAADHSVEVGEIELERVQEEVDELTGQRKEAAATVERLQGVVSRSEEISSDLRVRRRTLENDLESTDQQLQTAFTRASRARDRREEFEAEDDAEADSSRIEKLQSELREMESERASARAQVDKQRKEEEEWTGRSDMLRDRIARWEGRAEILQEMAQGDDDESERDDSVDPESMLAHQLRVPEGLESAVEVSLGTWLQAELREGGAEENGAAVLFPSVLDESLRRWWLVRWRRERSRWEDWCVNRGFGESVLGWLDDLVRQEEQNHAVNAAVSYFLQEFLVVEDRSTLRAVAEELWDDSSPAAPEVLPLPRLLTPHGDRADLGGGIAAARGERPEVVQRGAEVRQLQLAIEEARGQLAEAQRMVDAAEEQRETWQQRVDQLTDKIRDLRNSLDLRQAEEERRRREQERRDQEEAELQESTEQIADLQRKRAEIERQIERCKRASAELAAHRRGYEGKLAPVREHLADLDRQLKDAEYEQVSLRERIESERRRQVDLDREAERLAGQLRHWKESLKSYEEDLDRTEERRDAVRERNRAFENAVDRTVRVLNEVRRVEKSLVGEVEQLQGELRDMRQEREELEKGLNRIDVRLARAQTRYEQVESEVREAGLDPAAIDLAGDGPGEEKLAELRRTLSRIEARRRQLEPVNPLSIGEYRREAGRHRRLRRQREDISGALEGLYELLAGSRDELDTQFKESLRATSESFHRTFSDLFEGGHAELRLVGDSVWDGDVQVRVQPPGKKLTRLSLLSGGERALAGIAFLFALLAMRPAPICVFDEIDAALDDANTGRFARYVERWREEAQYLLITHQKRTMEAADAMHGVTMAEPGVSELVSVRLEGRDETDVADMAVEGNGEGMT